MTTMNKTKIEWADYVFNPVWGCLYNCPYCYAKGIAKRFHKQMQRNEANYFMKKNPTHAYIPDHLDGIWDFKPVWLESNFNKPFPKKPSIIFINSMSDIKYWKDEWRQKVSEKMSKNPRHYYVGLTKDPKTYYMSRLCTGLTITPENEIDAYEHVFRSKRRAIVNIEPLHHKLETNIISLSSWVIVGAETGNRKGKIEPKREWIENIVNECQKYKVPLFMKNNLQKYWDDELIQEYPAGIKS